MSKYAPGPWRAEMHVANDGTPWVKIIQDLPDGSEIVVATMGCSGGDVWGGYVGELEDARLIAAAPTMRDALAEIVSSCKFGCNSDSYCGTCAIALRALPSDHE
jgi:hypothetical protein